MVADDFTGACDAGVQFAERGFSSLVRISPGAPPPFDFELAILTTNSRNDAPGSAAAKVLEACRALAVEQREVLFKKIDSTLRGNLASELEAVLEIYPLALVAPAYPALGRTLENGLLRLPGSAGERALHLPTLLREQGAGNVVHLDRGALKSGLGSLIQQLKGKTIVVLDSGNEAELGRVARAGLEMKGRAVLVGSAGLAAAAAKVLAEKFAKIPFPAPCPQDSSSDWGSVALIVGSTHPPTKAQMDFLVRERRVTSMEFRRSEIPRGFDAVREKNHLLIRAGALPLEGGGLADLLPLLAHPAIRGVALSGGDTAFAVCRALGATGVKLVQEILPGIPWGRLVGGVRDGLAVATKAGGFGCENALAAVTDFLARQPGGAK